MSEAQDLIDAATAKEATARHYADLIAICDSSLPVVHDIARLLRDSGRTWAEVGGWFCLRIEGKTGEVVWDGRDYRQLRQDGYAAWAAQSNVRDALFELSGTSRTDLMDAKRANLRAEFPNPDEEGEA